MRIQLTLPIRCDCGHEYKIDALGVTTETAIVCPSCDDSSNLDEETIDRLETEFYDGINDTVEDDDLRESLVDQFIGAPEMTRAKVVDDGLSR